MIRTGRDNVNFGAGFMAAWGIAIFCVTCDAGEVMVFLFAVGFTAAMARWADFVATEEGV